MDKTPDPIVKDFKLFPVPKTYAGISVIPLPTITELRPEQPEKAELPMLVTEFGMVTFVKPEQPENAELPMPVTEFGMVTLVSPEQPENAQAGITCTLFPI